MNDLLSAMSFRATIYIKLAPIIIHYHYSDIYNNNKKLIEYDMCTAGSGDIIFIDKNLYMRR